MSLVDDSSGVCGGGGGGGVALVCMSACGGVDGRKIMFSSWTDF